jgi:hypothetical protein
MPHRESRRHCDRGRETPGHLTADRLSDIVRALPSQPSESLESFESFEPSQPSESFESSESSGSLESVRFSESCGPFRSLRALRAMRSSEASESSEQCESSGALETSDSSGSYESVGMRATRGGPHRTLTTRPSHLPGARVRQLEGPETTFVLTAASQTVGELFIVPHRTGRHRRPPPATFRVWHFVFTSSRLALIGLPALLLVGAVAVFAVR